MIKRYIPEKYDIDTDLLFDAIQNAIPNVPFIFKGRILIIEATLTTAQKQALKSAVLPLLENVTDISV